MSSQSWSSITEGMIEDLEGQGRASLARLLQKNVQISVVNPVAEGCHCIG